jgi:RNA polymerase sigma factor (TIGR02999 family)
MLTCHAMSAPDSDTDSTDALLEGLYDDLRREARKQLASNPLHTLQPTALLNEALVRLLSTRERANLNEGQLYTYVARAMRSVLVDHARSWGAIKRGGGQRPVPLDELDEPIYDEQGDARRDVLAVHDALGDLAGQHPELAELAELRFFGRLTVSEVAEVRGVPESRVKAASLYLRRILKEG